MQSLIRFGADQVMKLTGGTVTDEDIDAILARVRVFLSRVLSSCMLSPCCFGKRFLMVPSK